MLKLALEIQPRDQKSHDRLCRLLAAHDIRGLLAEHQRWAELHLDDAEPWRALAWALLRAGRQDAELGAPPRAIAAARKAVQLTENSNPKMLNTLALALAENDEHEEAITACEKALKLIEKQEQPDDDLKADLGRALKRYKRASGNQ